MMKPTAAHLVFLQNRLLAESPAWNLSSYLLFETKLPYELLAAGLNEITSKNDALRMRPVFYADHVELIVDPFVPRTFEFFRFDTNEQFLLWANERINEPVLYQQGMWTAFIIEVAGKSGIMNIGHHAMSDGYNVVVLYQMLLRYISGGVLEPQSYLSHLEKDTSYHNSLKFERDRRFWAEQLREPFVSSFFKEKAQQTDMQCTNRLISLPPDLVAQAEAFCIEHEISESVLVYAAVALTVYYLTREKRFSLGIPVLGRSTHMEMQSLGLFMHIVPLIVDIKNMDYSSFLSTIEEKLFDLFRHQSFSAYDISCYNNQPKLRSALYDIAVDYSEYDKDDSYESHVLYNNFSSMAMELHFLKQKSHTLEVTLRYWNSIASEPLVCRFSDVFSLILKSIIETLDISIIHTTFLMDNECQHLLFGFNDTAISYDKNKSVYDLFEEQLHRNGQACIRDEQREYTFAQLNADASRIDTYIRQMVGAEKQVIGILCDRSYAELVAIFGVIRGGNAYLPISPQYPAERIRTMLETSGCRLVLAQKEYVHLTDCAESVESVLAMQTPDTIPAPAARPEDTLYVIYTSGSTGTPKGAMVSNRSAVNRIQWMANRYFDTSTVVMRKTPYTFDVSVWEIFGFAMFGFSLYILPPDAHYNQNEVLAHIEKGQVTDLHFVPTVFEQFLVSLKNTPDAKQKLSSVRHVILSGESLLAKDVNAFSSYHDGYISIHNLYGPAECAVDVTAYDCAETEVDPIPIGRPIANTQIYIVDRYMQPVPIGVTGELCVAGDGVGGGYLNRPELTEEKFVENPFGEGKLYKTGDLAYWREDGNIVFVGRNDFQVKINGQRIELGEVEAALSGLDGIESAAVVVKEESDRKLLCAFYTGRQQEQQALRNGLQQTLPVYMVPQAFTHLEQMPLTTSGKIDRKALLSAAISVETYGTQYEPPQTPLEERICQVFCDILDVDRVGRGDSFYDLGGTSLDMIRLLCCDPLSALTPEAFMKDPTPASLAQKLMHDKEQTTILQPLYLPQHPQHALVLFPYAGGDASAYTALIAEARKQNAAFALYYVHWLKEEEFPVAAQEIRMLAKKTSVTFYSHCAGAVIALKLLDILNQEVPLIPSLIAGGNILPAFGKKPIRIWKRMTDGMILSFLKKAGLPLDEMPEEEVAALINRFRKDTDLFFDYIQAKTVPTPISVHLVLSKHDLFTHNYKSAASRWAPYVSSVQSLYYIDSKTHYFQAKDADLLFDYLTKKKKEG